MSSADTEAPTTDEAEPEAPRDELREALLAEITDELGDAVVGSHIRPGDDLWVRVTREAWRSTAELLAKKLQFDFFDFLSAIDWMPSPFGRDMDAQEDLLVGAGDEADTPEATAEPVAIEQGYAGGETRLQLLARVYSIPRLIGVTLKADLPDDDPSAPTWVPLYLGANWHEREVFEMFGISFTGHPDLRKLYLPSDFEGHPMRKDFPLLARRVKPWPGIVDVEAMPGGDAEEEPAS